MVFYQLCLLSLAIPALSLTIPALSLAIPSPSRSIPAFSLAVPGIHFCPGVILGFTQVGKEDSVAAMCSLSLIMVGAGAKLDKQGIKKGFVLNNMAQMAFQM